MNTRLIVFSAALLYSSAASAQQTTASVPPSTVQMECHDLASSGNFVASDETLVNGMACRQVKQSSKQSLSAQSTGQAAASTAVAGQNFATSAASAAPVAPAMVASMKIVAGAKVYIAPMQGFENYLLAAFGKKNVQLIPLSVGRNWREPR